MNEATHFKPEKYMGGLNEAEPHMENLISYVQHSTPSGNWMNWFDISGPHVC